jgi:hypothetical protein
MATLPDEIWILDFAGSEAIFAFDSLVDATWYVEQQFKDIWNVPVTMQCGSTEGVEMRMEADSNLVYFVYGDGWIARVRGLTNPNAPSDS